MENLAALGVGCVLISPRGERSFPALSETPRLLIDKSLGRPPVDWEMFHGFWFVSDRMKGVLEAVDRAGVAFLRCETRSLKGGAPVYWLCDVVRRLDVIDEEKSIVEVLDDGTAYRRYDNMTNSRYVFREEAIGSAHIFRPRFLEHWIICDQAMKDACKAAGVRGMRFGYAYGNYKDLHR
ncbi:imm11 family protein [Bradyrhizobium sp. USDA 313]|uniref:imm11 family protein n=1 Tax=Bradyrhizobium sp. USDA 313 TaxID=3156307 RepID=UPI0035195562